MYYVLFSSAGLPQNRVFEFVEDCGSEGYKLINWGALYFQGSEYKFVYCLVHLC